MTLSKLNIRYSKGNKIARSIDIKTLGEEADHTPKKLIIIFRNDGLRKGAGKTAREAFDTYGSAGGHKTMARAELDLRLIRKETKQVNKKFLANWIISKIEKTGGTKIN